MTSKQTRTRIGRERTSRPNSGSSRRNAAAAKTIAPPAPKRTSTSATGSRAVTCLTIASSTAKAAIAPTIQRLPIRLARRPVAIPA